jgi:hypothetical protein
MDFGVVVSARGRLAPGHTTVFYQNLTDAEERFPRFISAYPPVMIAIKSLDLEWVPLLRLSPEERPSAMARWIVDLHRLVSTGNDNSSTKTTADEPTGEEQHS